ncbi:MAG TPA: roadblock/LC7 domain-containing protein, partial [Verrucomicrobiae bacterium]|nr:roadblock/LC7 domain-containing protein [Verrucomicrobiae bacterium]
DPRLQAIPDPIQHSHSPAPARPQSVTELEMPLLAILDRLPSDLRSKWMLGGVDLQQATISVPVKKVLPQLALGAVKITFGELRNAAPTLFRTGEEYDSLPIALPLNEVLSRLNPALIPRNPSQRVVAPPTDIAEPFGPGAQGVSLGAPAAPGVKPAAPTTHFYKKAVPSEPIKMPTPPPVAAQPLPFVPRSTTPAAPPAPTPRVNFNGNGGSVFQPPSPANRNSMPGNSLANIPNPIQQMPSAKPPVPPPAPVPPPMARPAPIPMPKPVAKAPAPAPVPAAAPVPAQEAPSILAPLSALSEEWPESLRLEIVQLNLGNAHVALPIYLIEPALRRGRIVFSWHHVRSWIRPTPPVSVHDTMELELPLKVIAPLFLPAKKAEVRPQAKAEVPPSSVPNLFFGFPQPQPEEMAPPINMPEAVPLVKPLDAKINDSNFYVWGENGEEPNLDETDYRRAPAPATDFSTRRAMPNEIIARAMKLPGVTGAIIALGDGLKVAQQLPPELNADTVAAFLPQLFSRVNQCSKELRMGELNNLNFTLGNIPWKIFRVNAVYFAAFGVAGVSLPTAQLAMLAGELDRKK